MSDTTHLQARLLPNGRLVVHGSVPEPDATWQILGCTPHEGCLVRAELSGASWVTRIQHDFLAQPDRNVVVTLARQSEPDQEPLLGWILFC